MAIPVARFYGGIAHVPKIADPHLQAIVDSFESLVKACEDYRDALELRRPPGHRAPGIGGVYQHGRFKPDPGRSKPQYGTAEFREFAMNRQIDRSVGFTTALLDLMEGSAYDRLRDIVDAVGSLESTVRGDWV